MFGMVKFEFQTMTKILQFMDSAQVNNALGGIEWRFSKGAKQMISS